MNPAWSTDEVRAVISAARNNRDASLYPIAADALEEADCDDEKLLTLFRNPPGEVEISIACCGLLAGEYWDAVVWMDSFADKLSKTEYQGEMIPTLESVIQMGINELDHGQSVFGDGYDWEILMQDNLDDYWRNFEIITGRPHDEDRHYDNPILCSC